jgi:hypothetical protein
LSKLGGKVDKVEIFSVVDQTSELKIMLTNMKESQEIMKESQNIIAQEQELMKQNQANQANQPKEVITKEVITKEVVVKEKEFVDSGKSMQPMPDMSKYNEKISTMQNKIDELFKAQHELADLQKQGVQVVEKIIVKEVEVNKDKETPTTVVEKTVVEKEVVKEKTEVQIVEKRETIVEKQQVNVGLTSEEIEKITKDMKDKQLKMEEISKMQLVKLEENIKLMKKELEDYK